MLLKNAGGENIRVYCILDSDYHTLEQISNRLPQARVHQIELHIWSKKEIENYLLAPAPIVRTIMSRAAKRVEPPTELEVENQLATICERLRDDVFDAMATEILAHNKALGQGGADKPARGVLEERWKTPQQRVAVIPGKTALGQLSQWSQDQFGVSLSPSMIARQLRSAEIDPELRSLLQTVADCAGVLEPSS